MPLVRDAVLLALCRRRFRRVVLHIHGAGVGGVLVGLPGWVRRTLLLLIGRPDIVIQLTSASPADGEALRARRVVIVPNGIPDVAPTLRRPAAHAATRLLFLGTLRESKGVLVSLDSLAGLISAGVDATLTLAGAPVSAAFAARLEEAVTERGLTGRVSCPGHLDEAAKRRALSDHDVFVFPSFYSGENLSVAMIEAMRAGLPVVAADWRGARDLVEDGVSGILVEPRSAAALSGALTRLIREPALMTAMGARARARYVENFTEDRFLATMATHLRGGMA